MYHWTFTRPDLTEHLLAGRRARNHMIAKLGDRIAAAVAKATRAIVRAYHRRRAVATLRGLDDRMLRDIGIGRSEIRHVVEHGTPLRSQRPAETRSSQRSNPSAAVPQSIAQLRPKNTAPVVSPWQGADGNNRNQRAA